MDTTPPRCVVCMLLCWLVAVHYIHYCSASDSPGHHLEWYWLHGQCMCSSHIPHYILSPICSLAPMPFTFVWIFLSLQLRKLGWAWLLGYCIEQTVLTISVVMLFCFRVYVNVRVHLYLPSLIVEHTEICTWERPAHSLKGVVKRSKHSCGFKPHQNKIELRRGWATHYFILWLILL